MTDAAEGEAQDPAAEKVEAKSETQNVLDALANYGKISTEGSTKWEVLKTPGEFSHSKNPIDIMKDGAKIGEMTEVSTSSTLVKPVPCSPWHQRVVLRYTST